MKITQWRQWNFVVIIASFMILHSTACQPMVKDSNNPVIYTIPALKTETSQLATQVTAQEQIDDIQQEEISDLFTQMPSNFETITVTPTPLLLIEASTSYPVCTPPACAPDELYYCPNNCPGGCGTTCATATPGTSSGFGQVWGKICYPGETIPEMTIYFQEVNTQRTLDFSVEENQDSFQLDIPAGVYIAFAWLPKKDAGGGYTIFVRCNQNTSSCTDHGLVSFLVQENHVTVGVDICDWDGDATLFPALPEE